MSTNLLEAGTEALREGPAALRRFPKIGHDQRSAHRSQLDARATGARIPSQKPALPQATEVLRKKPAGMKVEALRTGHL